MKASEMVSVARLADFYEAILPGGHDALEVATHDFAELKRKAPNLVRFLDDSDRSHREIGDWLFEFFGRYKASGVSLKNFAADELERLESRETKRGVSGHATKKSPTQLQHEIEQALGAKPINKRKSVRHFSESKDKLGRVRYAVTYEDRTSHAITPEELARYRGREARGDVRKRR